MDYGPVRRKERKVTVWSACASPSAPLGGSLESKSKAYLEAGVLTERSGPNCLMQRSKCHLTDYCKTDDVMVFN